MKKIVLFLLLFTLLFPSLIFAQEPLRLDVLPAPVQTVAPRPVQERNVNNEDYKYEMPSENVQRPNAQAPIQINKKGEFELEGFVYKDSYENGKLKNFQLYTKNYGMLKIKADSRTDFVPSRAAVKSGSYICVVLNKKLEAKRILVPAIWDAKKRPGWYEFEHRIK